MKFTVNREKFLKSLQKVIGTIGSQNTLPVLGNVLIESADNALFLTTTNLELRITTRLEAEIAEAGSTTVPAKRLLALVNNLDDEKLTMAVDERFHAEVTSGSSRFKLLGIAPEDFPAAAEFTPVRTLKFKGAELKRMLGQIVYAITLNDSRKVLHGMLISFKESVVTMVATDGKRLAMTTKAPESTTGDEGDCIIPLLAATEIKRQADPKEEVALEVGEKMARFLTGDTVIATKLIEGNYPNFRQVIPPHFGKFVPVPCAALLAKIDLVSQVLSDSASCVMTTFLPHVLKLTATSQDVGEGAVEMPIEYDGEEMVASFNPNLLADPLRFADQESMTFKMNDGFSPVALEGSDGFLYIIMPMRR